MVTSPTGRGVIIMGGETNNAFGCDFSKFSIAMFELSISMEWTRLEQALEFEHYCHFFGDLNFNL